MTRKGAELAERANLCAAMFFVVGHEVLVVSVSLCVCVIVSLCLCVSVSLRVCVSASLRLYVSATLNKCFDDL